MIENLLRWLRALIHRQPRLQCVTQTNPDGRGDGDCEDEDCRARMPHDRFHRYWI